MANKFNVVYTGLQNGVTEDDFVAKFCKKFGVSEDKARKISVSTSDVTIKKDLDEAKAKQYQAVLESCGMIARLDEVVIEPEPLSDNGLSLAPMEKEPAESVHSESVSSDAAGTAFHRDEPENNPYATPEAELTENSGELGLEKVPVGSGAQWLGRGFWHFKQNPFAWIGSIVVFILVFMVLSVIPFIGALITNLLSPVIMAGFALGAQEQDQGGDFRVGHVFAGFSSSVGQLMLVGVIYLVMVLLIAVVFGVIMGGTMATSELASSGMMTPDMNPEDMMTMMGPGTIIMMLVAFVLIILTAMAYYYAPILIALEDMTAISAMKLSFRACLKNILAFIIYGLLVFVLFAVASIPAFLGLLVAIPMIQASIYVSYRDIFRHGESV